MPLIIIITSFPVFLLIYKYESVLPKKVFFYTYLFDVLSMTFFYATLIILVLMTLYTPIRMFQSGPIVDEKIYTMTLKY